jgi:Ca2+-binding EF-hand superfamily protein
MKAPFNVIPMATLLAALSIHPAFADDNAEAFRKLDVNGDGYISEYEALAHAELPDAFADGDENSDGLLDMAEFLILEISDD